MRTIEGIEDEGGELVKTQSNPRKNCEKANALLGKIEAFDSVSVSFAFAVSVSFAFVNFTVIVVVQRKRSDLYDHSNPYIYIILHMRYWLQIIVPRKGTGCLPRMWPCCLKTRDSSVVQDRGLKCWIFSQFLSLSSGLDAAGLLLYVFLFDQAGLA